MTVVIRGARADEREVVARIHKASATRAYTCIFPTGDFPWDETLARWQQFAGAILVAEIEGVDEPVGFVAFDSRELHALYVLPEQWSHGIGARLLEAAGAVSKLWVLEENVAARHFYEKHGWRPDGTQRRHNGVIELRYQRIGPA